MPRRLRRWRVKWDWPGVIARLRDLGAGMMVPGRGRALLSSPDEVEAGLAGTEAFTSTLFSIAAGVVTKCWELKAVFADAMDGMRPRFDAAMAA